MSTWQGHLWRLSGSENGETYELIYAALKEDSSDVVVIDDDLLQDRNDARKPKNEIEYPRVFIRDTSVWVAAEEGKEEEMISDDKGTNPYDEDRIYISPDKRYVVVWQYVPEQEHLVHLVESSPADQLQTKMKAIQYLKPGDRVRIDRPRLFNLAERKEVSTDDTLFQNPWDLVDIGWNKSASEYRFLFNERGHQYLRVIGVGVGGHVRTLVEEGSSTFIDYSSKLSYHSTENDDEMIWASERDGWNHLYLYDLVEGV